jgi:hypothetical protein
MLKCPIALRRFGKILLRAELVLVNIEYKNYKLEMSSAHFEPMILHHFQCTKPYGHCLNS